MTDKESSPKEHAALMHALREALENTVHPNPDVRDNARETMKMPLALLNEDNENTSNNNGTQDSL